MAVLNVNPTRMELKKLKSRLVTAVRGHKLLKDKSDEMIRRFTVLLKENKKLFDEVENELENLVKKFAVARAQTSAYGAEAAFLMPSKRIEAECKISTVMGVEVPEAEIIESGKGELPYAYAEISAEADQSVLLATELLPKMIKLAQTEKAVQLLANEIERNKRRVNALEYVLIPQLEDTIKYIKGKLDENERAAVIRLMKVKSNS